MSVAVSLRSARAPAIAAIVVVILSAAAGPQAPAAQPARQVKIVLEFQQQARDARQGVEGRGGIVIRPGGGGRAGGHGAIGVEDTTRRVTRSSGLFIVVQDGASGTLLVATEVPSAHVTYFHDYATGRGYVRSMAWRSVGTALVVRPTILPGGQIRVTVMPRVTYFTDAGAGSVELVEAATELIVSSGQRVPLGGASSSVHEVTRRILAYGERQASAETSVALTATVE